MAEGIDDNILSEVDDTLFSSEWNNNNIIISRATPTNLRVYCSIWMI